MVNSFTKELYVSLVCQRNMLEGKVPSSMEPRESEVCPILHDGVVTE